MDNQAVFDIVAKHLLTQNVKSMAANLNYCTYRGQNGTKCAIGALISDEHYSSYCEEEGIINHNPLAQEAVAASLGVHKFELNMILLRDLQSVHDIYPPSRWSEELFRISNRYGLDFNPATLTSG